MAELQAPHKRIHLQDVQKLLGLATDYKDTACLTHKSNELVARRYGEIFIAFLAPPMQPVDLFYRRLLQVKNVEILSLARNNNLLSICREFGHTDGQILEANALDLFIINSINVK